jgi:hypothetical protein
MLGTTAFAVSFEPLGVRTGRFEAGDGTADARPARTRRL